MNYPKEPNDPLETPWHTDFIIFLYFQIGKPSP